MVETLQDAVKYRGSSLADEQYVDLFGKPGEYQHHHKVYAREGEACPRCRRRRARASRTARPSSARHARSEPRAPRPRASSPGGCRACGSASRAASRPRDGVDGWVRNRADGASRPSSRARRRGRPHGRVVPRGPARARVDGVDVDDPPPATGFHVADRRSADRRTSASLRIGRPSGRGPRVPEVADAAGLQVVRRQDDRSSSSPGVTVVVGPNGSGKSNLVDAVAWVLGAQGPRTLRGGKMDDVIFAGTPDRPALGRAEVSLTIDNTAGLLPIEFSEVTITRTLFRTGDSEYQINGAPVPAARHPGAALRHRHRPPAARDRRAGPARRGAQRPARGPAGDHRGGGRHPEVPQAPRAGRAPARGDRGQPAAPQRPAARGAAPAHAAAERQADAARRHDGLVAELRAIRLHLAGHEIAGLQARTERLRDQRRRARRAARRVVQARLRELDIAVLDAEHALTAIGRRRRRRLRWCASRRCASARAGSRALRRREAARRSSASSPRPPTRASSRRSSPTPARCAPSSPRSSADAALLEERTREVEGLDAGATPVRPSDAEAALATAERQWRECENEAGRWHARADALAQALDSARARRGRGACSPASTGSPAASSTTSRSKPAPRPRSPPRSATRCTRSSSTATTPRARRGRAPRRPATRRRCCSCSTRRDTAVTSGATLAPAGAKALAACVRSRAARVCRPRSARLLAGVVLADGDWRAALDLALANPDLIVVTRDGDRFGGPGPWRLGGEHVSGITQAALEEAEDQATRAAEAARPRRSARSPRPAASSTKAASRRPRRPGCAASSRCARPRSTSAAPC